MVNFIEKIFLSSLTIRERKGFINKIKIIEDSELDVELISRWKLIVGEASEDYFNERLNWDNLNKDHLPKLIKNIEEFDFKDFKFPEWTILLKDFKDSYCASAIPEEILSINEIYNGKIPYIDLLLPILYFFSKRIEMSEKLLTRNAVKDMYRNFCIEASSLSAQSFLEDMREKDLDYRSYVDSIISNGYEEFFLTYPSLTRLMFTRGSFWIKNMNKLHSDFLKSVNNLKEKVGKKEIRIDHISKGVSETHRKGKSVYVLTTETGQKFVYKQRNILNDIKFYKFLEDLQEDLNSEFYIPWFVESGRESGYMEYVDNEACTNEKEVNNFYINMGSLLCVFYIFGSTDLHSENLISCRESPVFIDLETLLHPVIKLNWEHLNKLNEYIDTKFGRSVSAAAILPQWILGPDTQAYNNSALGGDKGAVLNPKLIWKNINQDDMTFYYEERPKEEDNHTVYLKNRKTMPQNYLDEILIGFESTYKAFLDGKCVIDKKIFDDLYIRFVFRPTKTYIFLLDYLNHPDYLKSGVVRSVEMERLAKGLLVSLEKKNIYWDVFEDELKQLENGDIPYYFTKSNKAYLASENGTIIENSFKVLGVNNIKNDLKTLSYKDMEFQEDIIRNSVKTTQTSNKKINRSKKIIKGEKSEKELVENTVKKIANKIIAEKIEKGNRATWVGYVTNIVSHTYGYEPIGLDLTNGNIGVGIFLASAYKYTGDRRYYNTLVEAVEPIQDVLQHSWSRNEFINRFGTGGTSGLGAFIYGFCKLYEYLNDEYFLDLAHNSFKLIRRDIIDKSIREDVVSGNAGLLLSLIKYFELTDNNQSLKMARYIKNRIIFKGFENGKFKNWNYQQNKTLLGYSHGSSGILYALSNYLKYEKDKPRLLKLLRSVLVYEEEFYSKEHNNWPDFRGSEPDLGIVSWCHGAVGIGMSRLRLYDEGVFKKESEKIIKRAYTKMSDNKLHILDTLCCGNAGRVDFMIELMNRSLLDKYGITYLDEIASHLVRSFDNNTLRYFSKFDTPDLNVGFYHGLSGIGYQLLRYLEPKSFNSVLLSR